MSAFITHGSGLLLGALLGFVLQRGRFCITGAFREVWTSGRTRWLTAYLIAIAVSSVGFFTLLQFNLVKDSDTPLTPLATVSGSLIFGVGIVLAGGCATGTYYRAGEGLIGSWLALISYAASAAIMKKGILRSINDGLQGAYNTRLTTVYEALGITPWLFVSVLVGGVAWLTWRHIHAERDLKVASLPPLRSGLAHLLFEKPWHPFMTAALIGAIATLAYPLSYSAGRESGLGITTPSANLAHGLIAGDLTELTDWGTLLVVGIIIGSYIAAKASGEFRLRVPDSGTLVKALLGGLAMGIGASLAGGCTIGGSLVGSAELSLNGFLSFAGFFTGVGLAAKFFLKPGRKTLAPSTSHATAATAH
jgi:hypothetical protein blinB_01687